MNYEFSRVIGVGGSDIAIQRWISGAMEIYGVKVCSLVNLAEACLGVREKDSISLSFFL